jgi:hypothetical protein
MSAIQQYILSIDHNPDEARTVAQNTSTRMYQSTWLGRVLNLIRSGEQGVQPHTGC